MTTGEAGLFGADVDAEAAQQALERVAIPACPAVVAALLEESRRETLDFQRVARLVSGDVAMAAAVLKTANSPFFALRRKIHSVQQAVTVLGLRNLLKIVYAVVLRQSLGTPPPAGLERFWEHSGYNAWVTENLARRWPTVGADDAYAFGLFHDAGIAALARQHADYMQLVSGAAARRERAVEVEQAHFGSAHPLVGALLARGWYLSDTTVWAIRHHHDPAVFLRASCDSPHGGQLLVALGLLAEHLVARFLGHPDDADWRNMRDPALARLGLDSAGADELLDAMQAQLEDIRASRAL